MGAFAEAEFNMIMDLKERLKEFMENEARSCSMDFGCITPEYLYRMWGGNVSLEEIAAGLREIRLQKLSQITNRY